MVVDALLPFEDYGMISGLGSARMTHQTGGTVAADRPTGC